MTDKKPRMIEVPLGFLKDGATYKVEVWNDTPSGEPATELVRSKLKCIGGANNKLAVRMSRAGGAVIILKPVLND